MYHKWTWLIRVTSKLLFRIFMNIYLRASDKYKRSLIKNDTRPYKIMYPPRIEVTTDSLSISSSISISFLIWFWKIQIKVLFLFILMILIRKILCSKNKSLKLQKKSFLEKKWPKTVQTASYIKKKRFFINMLKNKVLDLSMTMMWWTSV